MIEMLSSRFDHPWCEERPPAPVGPPPELIDAAELARRLGIARSTVYANARRFGAIRLGDGPRAPLRFDYAAALASLPRIGQEPLEILVPSSPDRLIEEGLRRLDAARGLEPLTRRSPSRPLCPHDRQTERLEPSASRTRMAQILCHANRLTWCSGVRMCRGAVSVR